MPQNFTCGKLSLVVVMVWCCQTTPHYPSQCWPRSMSQCVASRPQWVDIERYCVNGNIYWNSAEMYCLTCVCFCECLCWHNFWFSWTVLFTMTWFPFCWDSCIQWMTPIWGLLDHCHSKGIDTSVSSLNCGCFRYGSGLLDLCCVHTRSLFSHKHGHVLFYFLRWISI